MKFAVTDTETTGTEQGDQVVEIAICVLGEKTRWSSLVKPSVLVTHEARAAHHITDEELRTAWTMEEILERRGLPEYGHLPEKEACAAEPDWRREDVVFVAHNAEFDRRMLLQSGVPEDVLPPRTICTWRCALHLFPDAPRHSNQVLRYYLDLVVPKLKAPPHRAMPDVVVTSALLVRMLEERSAEELLQLTLQPALLSRVNFGKYRGMRWQDLDSGYLSWILGQDFDEDARHTARHWLRERGR